MTQNMHTDLLGQKNNMRICPKLSDLLGVPSEKFLDSEESFEEAFIAIAIERLVRYGKEKRQILKISRLSTFLCDKMGLGKRYCHVLKNASLIYDIGNLKIDPEIYRKEKRLSFEEFEIIKHHTIIGHDALREQKNPLLDMAALVSIEHHEWYDGSGYPYGLEGEQISISARIVALADTVVALSSFRSGREVMHFEEIIEHVQKRRGLHFDPHLVDLFLEHRTAIKEILS